MTPPEDQNGQYGAAYPGTGHDAFSGTGGGYAPGYAEPEYGETPYQESSPYQESPYRGPAPYRTPGPVRAAPNYQGRADDWKREPVPEADPNEEPLIRPYAMTGGRTRPRYQLAIEALISTTAAPERISSMLPEHQRICALCQDIKSVAEISALLAIPLGVARILVADLAESGLVAIHQPAAGGDAGGTPDVTLLERVLSGLRKL